ncbi:MAG: response regulator [Lachnospiraceae bacterium]|nr:response regulator [Lachnospiraceae bacterium]
MQVRVKTILVDDELWSVRQFILENCKRDIELVAIFSQSPEALFYAQSHPVDCALLDIRMPVLDGIALGRKLREINKKIILIYISSYEKYLRDAMLDVKADYFVLKPYLMEEATDVLERAKYLSGRLQKRVTVKTFGNFEVFIDGQFVEFRNQKAKELLAVCIDYEGGEVSMKKATDLLWENRDYDDRVKCLYRKSVAYLKALFQHYGIESVFVTSRGSCHVNRQEICCDYYEVLDGKDIKETLFDGKYMADYSWSEETCGRLCRMEESELD